MTDPSFSAKKNSSVSPSASLLVLIPTAAFVALHLVTLRAAPGALWRALAVWAVLFALAAWILGQIPAVRFYPKNQALQIVQSELFRLTEKPLKKGEVVIIIQGSSAVAACVKGRLLERLIREKGLPARVFVLSAAGSNHFERLELLRQWLKQLSSAQVAALQEARVLLFSEILYSYDANPFSGFAENAFSDRSIAYASPANFLPMVETVFKTTDAHVPTDPEPRKLIPLIAGHLLFNIFRVGSFPLVPPEKADYSNRGPAAGKTAARSSVRSDRPRREASFDYADTIREFRSQLRQMDERRPLPKQFGWRDVRDREIRRITSGYVDEFAYLTTPHIGAAPRRFERERFNELGSDVIRYDGGSDGVLAALDKPDYWHDPVHLTAAGGAVFTTWLAGQIVADWARIAGSSPKEGDRVARKEPVR